MSFTINFLPDNIKREYDKEFVISEAAEKAGIKLNLVCGGKGKCGKCKVAISDAGVKDKEVLACSTKINRDTTIYIPSNLIKEDIVTLTGSRSSKVKLNPIVRKVFVEKDIINKYDLKGDWERLKLAVDSPDLSIPPMEILRSLSDIIRMTEGFTVVIHGSEVVSVEEGDTTSQLYGMAVDIGSTTVASYLFDLNTGEQIAIASSLNKQNQEGADVMSRIMAAEGGKLEKLQNLIIETLNNLIGEACKEAKISSDKIYLITLVGNSTMQHLFLKLSPRYLGRTPFTSTLLEQVTVIADNFSLKVNPQARVIFLPLIGGFVGSDTTGVILATGIGRSSKLRMAIDIGTNGEMVLGNNKELIACSTAAGPALEGAGITFGMRGALGAIEDVEIDNSKISLKVIGGEKPKGICGSGLIAGMAEMLKAGLVHSSGRLKSREEFIKSGGDLVLAENLVEVGNQRRFILSHKEKSNGNKEIYLSQDDIRAVQLAKGAIFTGITILLEEKGLVGEELSEILLAGAFGNYIDTNKAQTIGLLPDFKGVPIKAVGNAAGAGAQKALLSKRALSEAQKVYSEVKHLDLASHPRFQEHFINSLSFPIIVI